MPEPIWLRLWWALRLLCDVLLLVAELDSVQWASGLNWNGWTKLYLGGMKALLIIALLVIVCAFTYYDTHMELFGQDSDTEDGFADAGGSDGSGWGGRVGDYHHHYQQEQQHRQQQQQQQQEQEQQPYYHSNWSEEDFLRHPKEPMSSQFGRFGAGYGGSGSRGSGVEGDFRGEASNRRW